MSTLRCTRTMLLALALRAAWLLAAAAPAWAQTPLTAPAPSSLTAAELAEVFDDIDALRRAHDWDVDGMPARGATPQRIDRLYTDPSLPAQLHERRTHGLIRGGQGNTLRFTRPSEVMAKMAQWFPDDLAAARQAAAERHIARTPQFHGPFAAWHDDAVSFAALWNCSPIKVWLHADRSPFDYLPVEADNTWRAINDAHLQNGEFHFGRCVEESLGSRHNTTMPQVNAWREQLHGYAARAKPLLKARFKALLTQQRCTDQGADDCVLVLREWAEMLPQDPEIPPLLRSLEADVNPDGTLPPLPTLPEGRTATQAATHFDLATRRAGFLRVKLGLILDQPKAWPADALAATLQQMQALRLRSHVGADWRWSYHDFSDSEVTSPFSLLAQRLPTSTVVRRALITAEDSVVGQRLSCSPQSGDSDWLRWGGDLLRADYLLLRLQRGQVLADDCFGTTIQTIRNGEDPRHQALRAGFLAVANNTPSVALRDALLSDLTDNGALCFPTSDSPDAKPAPVPAWLQPTCARWIGEPAHLALDRLRRKAQAAVDLRLATLPVASEGDAADPAKQRQLLDSLVPGNGPGVAEWRATVASLQGGRLRLDAARLWSHPQRRLALLEITSRSVAPPEPESKNGSDATDEAPQLWLLGADQARRLHVPPRLLAKGKLSRVMDLQDNGALQLAFGMDEGCANSDDDIQDRDLDCRALAGELGQIDRDAVTYIRRDTKPPASAWRGAPDPGVLRAMGASRSDAILGDFGSQNLRLWGALLESSIGVNFGVGKEAHDHGEILAFTSKADPRHPGQRLIALLHSLKDQPEDAGEVGFVVASVDMTTQRVLRLQRERVAQDASIQIWPTSLTLDTAAYNVAATKRAFGVRMAIGHSPRCAEGNESDYLWLLVETGRGFKTLLKDFAMSRGRLISGAPCNDDENKVSVFDNVTLQLSVASTAHDGWADLTVTATHDFDSFGGPEVAPNEAKPVPLRRTPRTHSIGTLRMQKGQYEYRGRDPFDVGNAVAPMTDAKPSTTQSR
ncbi:hypothetical protein [Sphaerotilus sp.]|uniref:hypothetical protein n=1 Tax=Sphaerotilus sp. TaxID=2093942 RepID=UPI0034E2257D